MQCLLSKLLLSYALLTLSFSTSAQKITSRQTDDLKEIRNAFAAPPSSARLWVYWFWVNSNVTRKGITADLAALEERGQVAGIRIVGTSISKTDSILR